MSTPKLNLEDSLIEMELNSVKIFTSVYEKSKRSIKKNN
jgi:hypothetical protein